MNGFGYARFDALLSICFENDVSELSEWKMAPHNSG